MSKPKHAWMVRAGNENALADAVEAKNAVAIGWVAMGDISSLKTREEFIQRYQDSYPESSPNRVSVNAGQVYRFAREIRDGDYVLTYNKTSREVLIGIAEGPCEYTPSLFTDRYPYIRRVQWLKRVSRDDFSAPARRSLGGLLTVFQLDQHIDEIHEIVAAQDAVPATSEEDEAPPFFEDVRAQADELIADLISRLDPYDFQDLVAATLRAMGFRAVSVAPGPDGGVDIVAHPDPFGFQKPRIKVQVKHRKGAVGGPEISQFLGTLHLDDNGLYVSTGGFTRDAVFKAESSNSPIKLLDRDSFIDLLLEHYETLEPEFKARIPLRKVWIPTL